MVTQSEIARKVGIDVSSVNKILNKTPGPVFRKETIKKVHQVARQLGYNFGKLKHHHRRADPRKPVEVPLELSIYLADGRLFERGNAVMRDVSLSGAILSGIVLLEKKGIPLEPHSIGIRLLAGPLKDIEIRSKPVRFLVRDFGIDLAIAFERVEEKARKLLRKII